MKKPPATEYGVADPDGLDREWNGEDLDSLEGESGEDEMKTDELAMQHACATCGETNTILPPRGHRFVRKSKVEREFEQLDESFALATAWRESYGAALRRRSCPLPT